MLYFIWTEEYGFEPVVFSSDMAALRYCETLSRYQAYRNHPPLIREISTVDLEDAAVLS